MKLPALEKALKAPLETKELHLYSKIVTHIPAEIGQLANLEFLKIRCDNLMAIPEEIGLLKKLTTLDVQISKITDLPKQIFNLSDLSDLTFIGGTEITTLPEEIGQLKNLKYLYLESNKLLKLPSSIGNLKRLEKLDIGWNQIQEIPDELWELTELTELSMSNNKIKEISPKIGNLKNLTSLILYNNALTSLPKEIGSLVQLTYLDFGKNKGMTAIPIEFENLVNLEKEESLPAVKRFLAKQKEIPNKTIYAVVSQYRGKLVTLRQKDSSNDKAFIFDWSTLDNDGSIQKFYEQFEGSEFLKQEDDFVPFAILVDPLYERKPTKLAELFEDLEDRPIELLLLEKKTGKIQLVDEGITLDFASSIDDIQFE